MSEMGEMSKLVLFVVLVLVAILVVLVFALLERWTREQTLREQYPGWRRDALLGRAYPDKTFEDFKRWMSGDLNNDGSDWRWEP